MIGGARRVVGGVTWTSHGHGRWAATCGARAVQVDALYQRRTRTGWAVSIDDVYVTSQRGLVSAMRRAVVAAGAADATLAPMPKGRPPDDEAKREVKVQIRAMATQRAAWHAAAALAGKDLSEWLRDLADEAARLGR